MKARNKGKKEKAKDIKKPNLILNQIGPQNY